MTAASSRASTAAAMLSCITLPAAVATASCSSVDDTVKPQTLSAGCCRLLKALLPLALAALPPSLLLVCACTCAEVLPAASVLPGPCPGCAANTSLCNTENASVLPSLRAAYAYTVTRRSLRQVTTLH